MQQVDKKRSSQSATRNRGQFLSVGRKSMTGEGGRRQGSFVRGSQQSEPVSPDINDEQSPAYKTRQEEVTIPQSDFSYITDAWLANNICTKKDCLSNKKPHRHEIPACKVHPYCVTTALESNAPVHTRLPAPLPINHKKFIEEHIREIEDGKFGETGPQLPGTKTVVTQESLDNYWAQQWCLNVDKMPGSLPDSLKTVQDMFQDYHRRKVSKTSIKSSSKQTLQKKMRQWSKADADKAQRDLEFLYLMGNQDPRIVAILQKTGRIAKEKQVMVPGQARKVPIGKYTAAKEFIPETHKDMIPIVYPTSMEVEPLIHTLNREHEELLQRHADLPGGDFKERCEEVEKEKKIKSNADYKEKIRDQRVGGLKKVQRVSKEVKKRMDSEHLNNFMQATEIQEIAERHQEFQVMLKERKVQMKIARKEQLDRIISAATSLSQNVVEMKGIPNFNSIAVALQPKEQPKPKQNSQFNTIQPADQSSLLSPKASKASLTTSLRRPQSTSGSTNRTQYRNNQMKMAHASLNSTLTNRPRLFSSSKHSRNMTATQTMTITEKVPLIMVDDELMSAKTMSVTNRQSGLSKQQVNRGWNRTQNFSTTSSIGAKTTTAASRPNPMKTFTITVRPNKRTPNGPVVRKPGQNQSQIIEEPRRTNDTILIQENSVQTVQEVDRSANVFTNLIDVDTERNGHFQKLMNHAKWQTDKDQLVNTMAFHLSKTRPVVKTTQGQEVIRTELSSHQIFGNSLLQKRLDKQLGIQNLPEVILPAPCQAFLSEVPIIQADKQKQDYLKSNAESMKRDACKEATVKQALTIPQEFQFYTSKRLDKQPPTPEIEEPKVEEPKVTFKESKQDIEEEKVAPRDPLPDSGLIAKERIETVAHQYIDRVLKHQKIFKANQAKLEDPFAEPESNANSTQVTNLNSPTEANKTRKIPAALTIKIGVASEQEISYSKIEPSSPGIGGPATGSRLKKVTNNILSYLDKDIEEQPYQSKVDMALSMPELYWEPLKLHSHIKEMDSVEFWQQKGLQCAKIGKVDAAMDYYKQGLRKNPNNHVLIYSVAVSFCQLKKYHSAIHWFSQGIDLHPRWVDGLCGIAITYFNMLDFPRALKFIALAKDNSKGQLLTNAKLTFEIISFIHATCLKMTHNLKEACNAYNILEIEFKRRQAKSLCSLLWGLVLIPLSDDRKIITDHYHYLNEYLTHISDAKVPQMTNQNLLLSTLCTGKRAIQESYKTTKLEFHNYCSESPRLDFANYSKSIWTLIELKSFFKRFHTMNKNDDNWDVYRNILIRAHVELYDKDQIAFLDNRIGVVSSGAIEIRRHHDDDLLKPYVVKKAIEGDIIGWAEGDNSNSSSPLSWLVSMQENSEIVFFSYKDWQILWNIQRQFSEQQIVIQKLEQNDYFSKLNLITKYHLVYESIELKLYFPGQLIMSVHERSPLCAEYEEYYRPGTSKFRREIDNKIMKQSHEAAVASEITAYLDVLNQDRLKEQDQLKIKKQQTLRLVQQQKRKTALKKEALKAGIEPVTEEITEITETEDEDQNQANEESKLIKINKLESNSDVYDSDSNSTDYGIDDAEQFMKMKAENTAKAAQATIQDVIVNTLEGITPAWKGLNLKSMGQPQLNQRDNLAVQDLLGVEYQGQRSVSSLARPESTIIEPLAIDRKAVSPDNKSKSRRKAFKSLGTQAIMELVPQTRIAKKDKKDITFSELAKFETILEHEADIRGQPISISHDIDGQKQISLVSVDVTPDDKKKPDVGQEELPQQSYKFLMDKQIMKIKNKDKDAKEEHKRRKQAMTKLLSFADQISSNITPKVKDKEGFKSLLTSQIGLNGLEETRHSISLGIQKSASQALAGLHSKNKKKHAPKTKHQSSGINNQLMVNQLQDSIGKLQKVVKQVLGNNEDGDNILYQVLVSTLMRDSEEKFRREEPKGVHFIDSGEVLVVGKNNIPNARMSKCDAFGMCQVLRKTGAEFLGDVRSGVRQVQTFFFTYEEFNKRLSIPEKIKLTMDDKYQARFEGVINFVQQRDKVPGDKLRRF